MRKLSLAGMVFMPALCFFIAPANASFHVMQIEQVIGGVNGDTTAQAIQLRMRAAGQNQVQQARLIVRDATGANPVLLIDMTSSVPNSQLGRRVLVVTSGMTQYMNPVITPNFVMTNRIPDSYMAAGSLTFEDDFGTVYWRLSWGGNAYGGSRSGNVTNDSNGNFGAFPTALPSTTLQALLFDGPAGDPSTDNAADYIITTGAAVFTNNANATFTVSAPCPVNNRGDLNADGQRDGDDIHAFVACLLQGTPSTPGCGCADANGDGTFTSADATALVALLLG